MVDFIFSDAFSVEQVTVSTVGPSPAVFSQLAQMPATLAWSLHSPCDRIRRLLVPSTRHTTVSFLDPPSCVIFTAFCISLNPYCVGDNSTCESFPPRRLSLEHFPCRSFQCMEIKYPLNRFVFPGGTT